MYAKLIQETSRGEFGNFWGHKPWQHLGVLKMRERDECVMYTVYPNSLRDY